MADRGHRINLIPERRIEARRRRTRARVWTVGLGAYTVVFLLASLVAQSVWDRAERVVATEVTVLEEQIASVGEKIKELQPHLLEAHLQLKASRAMALQPDWSKLLAVLGDSIDEQIVLQRCVLQPLADPGARHAAEGGTIAAQDSHRPMDYRLELHGLGRTQQAVSRYVLRMEQTGLFDRVTQLGTGVEPYGGERVTSFRIECIIRDGTADAGEPQA